jgi:heat shock protein beta
MTPDEMSINLVRGFSTAGVCVSLIEPQKGTLAKSGTAEFLAQAEGSDATASGNLIGAFGLGFYSRYAPLAFSICLLFS